MVVDQQAMYFILLGFYHRWTLPILSRPEQTLQPNQNDWNNTIYDGSCKLSLKAVFVEVKASYLLGKRFCERHCLIVFSYPHLVGRKLSKQQLQYSCTGSYALKILVFNVYFNSNCFCFSEIFFLILVCNDP